MAVADDAVQVAGEQLAELLEAGRRCQRRAWSQVRRTWAPRGQTPILIHAYNWAQLSISSTLAFRWDAQRTRLFFQTRPGSYNSGHLIAATASRRVTLSPS